MVIGTLKHAGLEVQPTKSKLWSRSADMRQSNSLPVHPAVDEFAALVKRSVGGTDDVATFVTTAPTRIIEANPDFMPIGRANCQSPKLHPTTRIKVG